MRDNSLFKKGIEELGITLSENQFNAFEVFYDMLVEKNKVMNLTGITEYEEVLVKHFLDSLSVVKAKSAKEILLREAAVLDVGTGAGFPGVPLKIAFPQINITLMDSLNKRINFLNEVISSLKLTGICALHARCEEFARKEEFREKYELCVSRAVAKINSLSELCLPFVKVGGYFVPYKSGNIDEELLEGKNAISKLGGRSLDVVRFNVPCSDNERSLIVIKKESPTPKAYPRAGGKVLSKPL